MSESLAGRMEVVTLLPLSRAEIQGRRPAFLQNAFAGKLVKHGVEVDFVLYGERGLIAIEVKRSASVHPQDLRALKEFKQDYPPARCYLLYGGTETLYLGDVTAVPVEAALREMEGLLREVGH